MMFETLTIFFGWLISFHIFESLYSGYDLLGQLARHILFILSKPFRSQIQGGNQHPSVQAEGLANQQFGSDNTIPTIFTVVGPKGNGGATWTPPMGNTRGTAAPPGVQSPIEDDDYLAPSNE